MARIHRKLFPSPTTTNQTQECPDFCDRDCPYNCYTFPDLYFPPPPPPPPPSISSNQISSYLIILTSLFTIIFVLVGFYVIKAKCYADWCGSGRRRNGSGASQSDISDEEFVHGNQVDHPIWLIASVGLQQSIINSITVCRYRKREGLIEGTECSVCLNEFQEDETLRLLPKCNHAFHVTCIDTWLRSHINCPLCRAGIVSNTPEAAMSNFRSLEENSDSNSVRRNQDSRMVMEQHNDGEEAQEELSDAESALKEGPNDTEENREISCASLDETEGETVHLVKKDGECSTRCKSVRGSSIAQCLHLSPISMKRSISCNARILSTRSCRSLHWSLPY